jgi:hypothetical protein
MDTLTPKQQTTINMTTRNIEVEDCLPDRVEVAIDKVKEELIKYLNENDPEKIPCLSNDLDYSGAIHEIVDSSVPIYTHNIETAWYLHGRELERAYFNAGVGDNPRENDGMAAIYYYIHQEVCEWYSNNAEDIFDTYKKEKEDEENMKKPLDEKE